MRRMLFLVPLSALAAAVCSGCSAHSPQQHDPDSPCGAMFERYLDCGYDTNIPGLPEQQERLLRIESGECDAELTCYAECMTEVDATEDECWRCELTDTECRESPASECPGMCD